jgi:glycosyltransferase involved in cell wall biosynthesis
VHVINGIWAESAFAAAALVLGKARAKVSIYAECPDITVHRSMLRRSARTVIGRWMARHASGLFAVSHFASDYFARMGFPKDKIYPFGYFRAMPGGVTLSHADGIGLVYVGQLVHRKGIDVLLEAMAPLWAAYPNVNLRLIGVGSEHASIVAKVLQDGVAHRVMVEGSLPSSQIHEFLGRSSALVLPSRWDGWGLVVNEALSAGIPVIASDRCGAADMILHGVNGYVFRSEDVDSLRASLRALLEADDTQMRHAALVTSSALAIPVVSSYFVECLEHMCGLRSDKPTPPWEEVLSRLRSESNGLQGNDPQHGTKAMIATQKSA